MLDKPAVRGPRIVVFGVAAVTIGLSTMVVSAVMGPKPVEHPRRGVEHVDQGRGPASVSGERGPIVLPDLARILQHLHFAFDLPRPGHAGIGIR